MDAEPSNPRALAKARGSWGTELPDLQHHEAYDADRVQKVSDAQQAVEAETPLNMKEVLFDPRRCGVTTSWSWTIPTKGLWPRTSSSFVVKGPAYHYGCRHG